MDKKIRQIFETENLEVNDKNFKNIIASLVCQKHEIDMATINKYYMESYQYIEVKGAIHLNLYSVFDSFMMTSRREETGSYYTPYALADRMVRMSFFDYFKKNGFEESMDFFYKPFYFEDSRAFVEKLLSLKIADIACGTGVFLIAAIKVISEYLFALKRQFSIVNLLDMVYGYDIQQTPLDLLNLFFLDLLLEDNQTLTTFNLKCCDTILYAGETKFDIIIGNPPYIGEKGNKVLFDQYKLIKGYEARMDLFYFFIYRGYDMLSDKGILSFITTNYWITADGAKNLRMFIKDETRFMRLINLDECKFFKEAKGMHNLIFTLTKSSSIKANVQVIKQSKVSSLDVLYDNQYQINHELLFSENNNIILYEKQYYYPIIDKMIKGSSYRLDELASINQGIVSGADKVTKRLLQTKINPKIVDRYDIKENDPIYVFEEKSFESHLFKPFYKNGQIKPYKMSLDDHKWILYLHNGDIDETDKEWQHLLPFKALLEDRREVKSGTRAWYALQWGRHKNLFEGEKIIVPQRSNSNKFAYTDQAFYSSADVYYISKGPLKFLLGILNSKIFYFWLYNRGKRKGKSLELYAKPLSRIPIPNIEKQLIEECVEEILNDHLEGIEKIDNLLYTHYNLTGDEIKEIEQLYNRGRNEKKTQR